MAWIKGDCPISFPGLGIEINPPQGFSIGTMNIQFYGIIIALGLVLAVVYGLKRRQQFGLTEDDLLDGVLCVVPVAIICARLYFVAFSWDYYKDHLGEIIAIWNGGIAIYGGVIGAALGILVYCKCKKLKIGAVLDIVALGFLIGQAMGRWGNFFNREAFGAETTSFLRMGLQLDADRYPTLQTLFYHPTFLYESAWNAAGFVILHFLSKKRQYDGQIALGYVAWYGLGRTFIEGLRTDSLYIGAFRVSQVLAAISCLAAVTVLIVLAFRKHDKQNLFVNIRQARELPVTQDETTPEETE